jgi:hypothetical protein
VVYERRKQSGKGNGILDLVPSCVNSKCVISTRGYTDPTYSQQC